MTNSKAARPILGLVLILAVALGVIALQMGFGVRLERSVRWALVLALLIPGAWLTLAYWRAIDEAAREAQKTAWYWGGSMGMGAGLILVTVLRRPEVSLQLPPGLDPMTFGGLVVVSTQAVGFVLAWAWWWWSKR